MATQRRKSSIQKRRSSMKRKYMKSRKVKGGLPFFGMFDKKGGEDPKEPKEEEKPAEGIMNMIPGMTTEEPKDLEPPSTEGDVVEGDETPVTTEESQEGGKKKKKKGTKKKKKGSKKRKTAKKAKKSKKKKGKK